MGLRRDIDLALHLPLRYEDETRIVRLADARDGDMVQIEGQITHSEITFRGRRQLRVTIDDGSDTCVLRFINFYPSHQKTLSVGAQVRVRGEIRGGFVGREMVHPSFKLAGGELPGALTPVYSTVAGLPQVYLRKAVLGGLQHADTRETIPAQFLNQIGLQPKWNLREALQFLHHPTPDVALATFENRSHPAWQRPAVPATRHKKRSHQNQRRPNPPRKKRSKNSACAATSTWPCTCRCATKTKPASCAWLTRAMATWCKSKARSRTAKLRFAAAASCA